MAVEGGQAQRLGDSVIFGRNDPVVARHHACAGGSTGRVDGDSELSLTSVVEGVQSEFGDEGGGRREHGVQDATRRKRVLETGEWASRRPRVRFRTAPEVINDRPMALLGGEGEGTQRHSEEHEVQVGRREEQSGAVDGLARQVEDGRSDRHRTGIWQPVRVTGAGGCLLRRLRVRLRMQGNPWLGVRDVVWSAEWVLGRRQRQGGTADGMEVEGSSWVSRAVASQLSWEVEQGTEKVEVRIGIGEDEWRCELRVHDDDEPSVVLGRDAERALKSAGWRALGDGVEDESDVTEPEQSEGGDLEYEGASTESWLGSESEYDSGDSDGESDAGSSEDDSCGDDSRVGRSERRFWRRLVKRHQHEAVEGEEPGGLVAGEQWEVPTEALRDATSLRRMLEEWESTESTQLQAGPDYSTPEGNDERFKRRGKEFVPEGIHGHYEQWLEVMPRCDSEVLRWIKNKIVIRAPPEAKGVRMRNGKTAQEQPAAMQRLMGKRLRNKTWRCADKSRLVNLISLNLVDKPSADPPYRLTVWPKDLNEHLPKWSVRYEGIKKLPLVVWEGAWLICIDLESGYDAMGLHEDTKPLFGARFYATSAFIQELEREGLLVDGCLGEVDADGGAWVHVESNTLPQGFSWACAIFTKVVRQMVREWRSRGFNVCHMIDDLLFAFKSYALAIWGRDYILGYLAEKGWCVSWLKAVLTPTQRLKFLGFVVDTVLMRLFLPGEKVEKIEGMLREVVESGGQHETHRSLASVAGSIVAAGPAIPPARMFTRHTYKCIRPEEGEYDAAAQVVPETLEEMRLGLKYIRRMNQFGGPIRRKRRMCEARVISDASEWGFGYRFDGRETRDMQWDGQSRAVAAQWTETWEHQVHRELAAVREALRRETKKGLADIDILWFTDSKAVEVYLNECTGTSDVMSEMAREIWWICAGAGISLRAEHMAGIRMVQAGVDSMSRASEFSLSKADFKALNADARWGHRWGFSGFTVDLCASEKTAQCGRYYSRGGHGAGSLGDVRSARLSPGDLHYVVPPPGLIEQVCGVLMESRVAAVLVVPLWVGRDWNLWLRYRAEELGVMPWRSSPPVWVDVSERKPKMHIVASEWSFMVVALDFRQGEVVREQPLEAPRRRKDKQPKDQFRAQVEARWKQDKKPGGQGYRSWRKNWLKKQHQPQRQKWSMRYVRPRNNKLVVLSLCGGMATVAVALQQVVRIFNLDLQVEVHEVEQHEWARKLGTTLAGSAVRHKQPHDLWCWLDLEDEIRAWLSVLQPAWFVMGYSCQDVSTAFKTGKGLRGPKSSVYFAGRTVQRWAEQCCADRVHCTYECTWFKEKHPADWRYVTEDTGYEPQCVEAALVAPARRKRAFWSSFPFLPLQRQEEVVGDGCRDVSAITCLEDGRVPAYKWVDKMPTIMASGPRSWNMRRCVAERVAGRWRLGPMRITEAETAMGFKKGATEVTAEGEVVPEEERWRAVGNAINLGVLKHVGVSLLVCLGYITRDDVRQKGQIWTVNQDGPGNELRGALQALGEAVRCGEAASAAAAQCTKEQGSATRSSRKTGVPRAQLVSDRLQGRLKKQRRSGQLRRVTMKEIYDRQDQWGVPQTKILDREVGRSNMVKQQKGDRRQYLRDMVVDGIILEKSEKTWRSYGHWAAIFEVFCEADGVQPWEGELERTAASMQEALADLFEQGQYAVRSLGLMLTAVNSRLTDLFGKNLTQFPEIKKQLTGYEKKEGLGVRKKPPTTDEHVAAFMDLPLPQWAGKYGSLQWVQLVAMVIVAWSVFLRRQEISELQTCDVSWNMEGADFLIRKTKNDTKSYTRTSRMEAEIGQAEERNMLNFVREYVVQQHGGLQRPQGCTKEERPAERCKVCAPLFPTVCANKVKAVPYSSSTLNLRLKKAYWELEARGLVPEGQAQRMSVQSLRRGGNTIASAAGIRRAVRQKLGRWRTQRMPDEYDDVVPGEEGDVSRALQQRVRQAQVQ